MHMLALIRINQQTKFKVLSFIISKDTIGAKFKKTGSRDPDHDLSAICLHLISLSLCKHLITLASAVPEILLLHTKI